MKSSFQTRRLTTSAMMIALATVIAFVCGLIPFLNFPFGGGITIASMLPIVLISYFYGIRWGLLSGFTYSIIQMLLGFNTVSALFTPESDSFMGITNAVLICLIDYVLAYTALDLGGLFRKQKNKVSALVLGTIVSLTVCYIFHIISGAIFYGAWADWFFTQPVVYDFIGKSVLANFSGTGLSVIYSIVYNGCYMIPEIILSSFVAVFIARLPQVHPVSNTTEKK